MKLKILAHKEKDVPRGVESHSHFRQGLVSLIDKKYKKEMNVNLCGEKITFEANGETRSISIIELAWGVWNAKVKTGNKCSCCEKPLWKTEVSQ